jgi:pimeloyl-ACP methyl ester carboxylesterase
VAAALKDAGLEVHTPDLPGHGENQNLPLKRVTLASYVDSLTTLLTRTGKPCVLVAHSMAGVPVTLVAARNPALLAGIVYISAYLPLPGESLFDLMALHRQEDAALPVESALQMSSDRRTCMIGEPSIIPLFYNRCSAATAARAAENFGAQATLPLSAKAHYEEAKLNIIPEVYICCSDDRVLPLQHQYRMLQRRHCRELLQIDADHSPFLSCPDELSGLLRAAIANLT